jgi:hypothetical protein
LNQNDYQLQVDEQEEPSLSPLGVYQIWLKSF